MNISFKGHAYSYLAYTDPEQVAILKAEAIECLATWGDFMSCADRVPDLIAKVDLTEHEFRDLARQVERTGYRAVERAKKANRELYRATGDSHMSDADVTAAIRFLTARDADHARDANNQGWSSSHSSTGHWCYAMLSIDPTAAIAVGRTLVCKYQRQLARGGII